jgi:glutaredoxin
MTYPYLELFKFDSCPYCQLVMHEIENLNIKVEMRDIIANAGDRERLLNDTGRQTVPCLYIDNKPMFESRDIVNWLNENQSNLEKA